MKPRDVRSNRVRRMLVAGLLAGVALAASCSSSGGSQSGPDASRTKASADGDKFCGRRMDTDCDPRKRDCVK